MRKAMAILLVAAMLLMMAPVAMASSNYLPLQISNKNWWLNGDSVAYWNSSTNQMHYGTSSTGTKADVTVAMDTSRASIGEYTLTITGSYDIFTEYLYSYDPYYGNMNLGTTWDRMILIPYSISEINFNYTAIYINNTPAYSFAKYDQSALANQYYVYFKPVKGGTTAVYNFLSSSNYIQRSCKLTVVYVDSDSSSATGTANGAHLAAVSVTTKDQANNVSVYNSGKELIAEVAALTKDDCDTLRKGGNDLSIRVKAMKSATTAFAPYSSISVTQTSTSSIYSSPTLKGSHTQLSLSGTTTYMLDNESCFIINLPNLLYALGDSAKINDYSTRMGGGTMQFTVKEPTVASAVTFDVPFVWRKVERGDNALVYIDKEIEVKVGDAKNIEYVLKNQSGFGANITWKALNNTKPYIVLSQNKVTGLSEGTVYVLASTGTEDHVVKVSVVKEYSATTPTATQSPSATQTPTSQRKEYIVTASSLRVRAGAGTSHKQLGSLKRGAVVTVTEILDNGWSKIIYNGQTGYLSNQYLSER